MGNRSESKYVALIIIFSVLFAISMIVGVVGFKIVGNDAMMRKVSYRLNCIQLDEKMGGPKGIFGQLFLDDSYEKEFDEYWDFADVQVAYIQAKFSDKSEEAKQIIEEYIASDAPAERKKVASEYLESVN